MSDSLRPHESQHARLPCPSQTPRVYSNSCPLSWWCHPAISSSVVPFKDSQHENLKRKKDPEQYNVTLQIGKCCTVNGIKFLKDIYVDLSMKIFSGSLDEKPTVNKSYHQGEGLGRKEMLTFLLEHLCYLYFLAMLTYYFSIFISFLCKCSFLETINEMYK